MHAPRLVFAVFAGFLSTLTVFACSSSSDKPSGGDTDGGTDGGLRDEAGNLIGPDGEVLGDGRAPDGDAGDGGPGSDGATDAGPDADGGLPGVPGILTIGRFDSADPQNLKTAWPGASIIAQFDGTEVSATLSHADGFSGGPSWFNVMIDGAFDSTVSVSGQNQLVVLKAGLPAGVHKVELQKRTEANLGTVTFSGFTFAGGAGLLPPPARQAKRIEWLADSTIDGFGVDGDRNVTCIGNAPPQYNDVRKSTAWYTSSHFDAEMVLLAYSGKGITKNESPGDTQTFPLIYGNTIPDPPGVVAWNFANSVPDVVVLSVGGTDVDGVSVAPAGFANAYNTLLGTIRTNYPNAHVFATVWSQIKDLGPPNSRTAMTGALSGAITTRRNNGDTKMHFFAFPQSNAPDVNETGCYYHASAAHHQAMANLLITEIETQIPGF